MNSNRDKKLLRSLALSQERKKYYSINTIKNINTYKCPEHNEYCLKVCLKCNIDICSRCEKKYHNNHKTVNYEDINPDSSEIDALQKKINAYIDKYNNLKKEINNWYTQLKNKIYDFGLSLKNNEIINSLDFIINYPKNKICLGTILKFRKIYYNIMEDFNTKNKKIITIINQFGNNDNLNLPPYYDYFEIKNLIQNLNYNKDNFIKKGEFILNYLSKIPYIDNNTSGFISKSSSFYNNIQKSNLFFSNDLKNSEILCDRSTGHKNSNENFKTYSEKKVFDSKVDEFKNIINKTKIPDFTLISTIKQENSNKLNRTFNLSNKKNSITDFTKYLNKMGYKINEKDIHNANSCQDLLNKSSYSIKSTKYTPIRSNSINNNLFSKKPTNLFLAIKSPISSYKNNNTDNNLNGDINKENKSNLNKKIYVVNNEFYLSKNNQTKKYIHKKFNNNNINNNINNLSNNKKNNFIKFQKKIIIINKSNKHNNNNNLQSIKKVENKEKINNIENKKLDFDINNNINNNENQKTNSKNNPNILNQKIVREKQINDDILSIIEKKKEKIYSSPKKPDFFKNAIISDAKKKVINDYDNDNEESNIHTTEKKNLLNIIYSSSNKKDQINSKQNKININNNKENFLTYKVSNSTNINLNTPNIIKTCKNSSFFVDPEKEICIGLELGNAECRIGVVNQNTSEIQLVCFEEDKYSIPTLVSFGQNKKEIKIGYKAEEDMLNNPSQTIFNIIKFFGQKYSDVKGKREFWPFKVFYQNNDENKPYIKINFGPQKDKIFYFENILCIFLQNLFEILFNKVKLENSSNYNTQEKFKKSEKDENISKNITTLQIVLVLTVPNYFSFYQRKLIEEIIKKEIFPEINSTNINENNKIYGKFKINLLEIKIENASSIASLCLNPNYDINNSGNKYKNILILNIDGGSTNISITSLSNENEKQTYQVKAINGLPKGENDLIDDFMYAVFQRFDKNIKKEILESSFALSKLRKLCRKIRINLIQKEKYIFNIVEILDNYDSKIEINSYEYENSSNNYFNNVKLLINETLNKIKIKEKDINDIIFIGELCREKRIAQIVEQLFKQENSIYEELIYSNYMDNEKDFYLVGGAAYNALDCINKNIYTFYDISTFNLGIQKFNGDFSYFIIKGDKIPGKFKKTIKISNEKQLKIYEKLENGNKLIGIIPIGNIIDTNKDNLKYGFRELKIEYEINDKLELLISILNMEKSENKVKLNLLFDNFTN